MQQVSSLTARPCPQKTVTNAYGGPSIPIEESQCTFLSEIAQIRETLLIARGRQSALLSSSAALEETAVEYLQHPQGQAERELGAQPMACLSNQLPPHVLSWRSSYQWLRLPSRWTTNLELKMATGQHLGGNTDFCSVFLLGILLLSSLVISVSRTSHGFSRKVSQLWDTISQQGYHTHYTCFIGKFQHEWKVSSVTGFAYGLLFKLNL